MSRRLGDAADDRAVAAILDAFDPDHAVGLLRRLVRIPSVHPRLEEGTELETVAAAVADELSDYGVEMVFYPEGQGKGWGPNVVAMLGGEGDGPTLILTTHYDVVPPYDRSLWWTDPFGAEVIDGVMHGRGTVDAKGSMAGMLAGLRTLVRSRTRLKGTLKLVCWAGDEAHPPDAEWFSGITYLVGTGRLRGDALIWGEPYDRRIIHASRGRVWVNIEVAGVASHAASGGGVNAIRKAMLLIDDLYGLRLGEHPLLGRDTINVGKILGGTQTNIVPDSCTLTLDIRFGPPLTVDRVMEMVRERIQTRAQGDPDFQVKQTTFPERKEPAMYDPRGAVFQAMVRAGEQALGRTLPFGGAVSFGDTSEWREAAGVEDVCFFGPGKTVQAHAVNENIVVEEFLEAAKVYALTVANYCGTL